MNNLILILSSVILNAAAQLFIKKGMSMVGNVSFAVNGLMELIPAMITNIFLWIAMICYGISIFLWMAVLSKVDVSYAYPFLSIGYIIAAVAGYMLFNESISGVRILGIIVICVGVILVSRS